MIQQVVSPCGVAFLFVAAGISQDTTNSWPGNAAAQEQMDLAEFGRLPARYNGRVTTLDSVARNFLKRISDRDVVYDAEHRQQPAIRWLLALMTNDEAEMAYRIFRIEHPKLLALFDLPTRTDNDATAYRYSVAELGQKFDAFLHESRRVREIGASRRGDYEWELAKLDGRMTVLVSFKNAVLDRGIGDREEALETFHLMEELDTRWVPLLLPPADPDQPWQHLIRGSLELFFATQQDDFQPNSAAAALRQILVNYQRRDAAAFNRSVAAYHALLPDLGTVDSPFDFAVPAGWLELGTPARAEEIFYIDACTFGSTVVALERPVGDKVMSIRVNHFQHRTAGPHAIVNKTRTGAGLFPLDEQAFDESVVAIRVGGLPGIQADMVTPRNVPLPRNRTIYTICEHDGHTWVLTMTGPLGLVNEHEHEFRDFLRSIRIAETEKVASWVSAKPPDDMAPFEDLHLVAALIPEGDRVWMIHMMHWVDELAKHREPFLTFLKSIRFPEAHNKDDAPILWTLPEGWRQLDDPLDGFAELEISDNREIRRVVVQPLAGTGQLPLLALANQWQRYLQADPIGEAHLARLTESVEINGRRATLIYLQSRPSPTGPRPSWPIDFKLPAGWRVGLAREPIVASLSFRKKGQLASIFVTRSDPEIGVLQHVNLSRTRLGLSPLSVEQFQEQSEPVTVFGEDGAYLDFTGDEQSERLGQRVLGVVVHHGENVWLFEMSGPADLVEEQHDSFHEFVKSVKLRKPAIDDPR